MSSRRRRSDTPVASSESTDAAFVRRISLALILAAFLAGWIGIGRAPFWVDESIAVLPAAGILTHGAPVAPYDLDFMPWQIKFGYWDPATPLYRYTLALIFGTFGVSERVARGFSWVVGFLALIPLHAAGRAIFGRATAWYGIALLAASPAFALFAREARHHTFVLLMAALMIAALLAAGRPDAPPGRRMLWILPLLGALLSQTIGYIALPVAALYVTFVGTRRFVGGSRAVWVTVSAATLLYAIVIAIFWDSLPFFHDVGCDNRPAGCHPETSYYLRVLYELLLPVTSSAELGAFSDTNLWIAAAGPLLFVVGLLAVLSRSRRQAASRSAMTWIWLLTPLLLLSTQQAKFPRFLFVWTLPIATLITALGATHLAGLARSTSLRRGLLVGGLALLVVAPQLHIAGRRVEAVSAVSTGLGRYLRDVLWNAPADTWYQLAAKARFLESRVQDGDEVVTSFDDAGLGHYLHRFVHGFLNSSNSDESMMELLQQAERRDRRVWFVDTLPELDFCLTDEPEPVSVDCRKKYARFYQACLGIDRDWSHRCRRVDRLELVDAR